MSDVMSHLPPYPTSWTEVLDHLITDLPGVISGDLKKLPTVVHALYVGSGYLLNKFYPDTEDTTAKKGFTASLRKQGATELSVSQLVDKLKELKKSEAETNLTGVDLKSLLLTMLQLLVTLLS